MKRYAQGHLHNLSNAYYFIVSYKLYNLVKIIDRKEDQLNFTVKHLMKLKILNMSLSIIYENIFRLHVYCECIHLCNICPFMKTGKSNEWTKNP